MQDEQIAKINAPAPSQSAPDLVPTSWGFQPFIEGMMIIVFTPDAKPVAQVMITWDQVMALKDRAVNPAPFKLENTPMSPFSPREAN